MVNFQQFNESISPESVYTDKASVDSVINKQRPIGVIGYSNDSRIDNSEYIRSMQRIREAGLKTIHTPTTDGTICIFFHPSKENEEEANELLGIAKRNGYVNSNDPSEVIRIGQILRYNDASIKQYVKKKFPGFLEEKKVLGPKEYYAGLSKSTAQKRASQMKKQSQMNPDDPDAYKKLPGDSKKTKVSKYTKKFAEMFGESEMNEKAIANKSIETALKNKLEAIKKKDPEKYKGVTLEILREVMRRGMGAWRTGHRPGAGEEQWGYARCNSFLTGGKTIGTTANPGPDGDLGKKAGLI